MPSPSPAEPNPADRSAWAVFLIFLRLGLTSFGGPVAHLGYFRSEFVERRRWLSEAAYADFVALCQFLPGPASSQVGLALGLARAGYAGAFAAWAGFTLPSAIALIALALGLTQAGDALQSGAGAGLLHGLKVVAVAVVAQAVWGMARSLCPDAPRRALMLAIAALLLAWPGTGTQLLAIALAGVLGLLLMRPAADAPHEPMSVPVSRTAGAAWLALFFALLLSLPLLLQAMPSQALALVDAFYRAGALVFGGGHVVLPLLQASVVPPGWVSSDAFLAGYGAAQAVPGPLFTFAAFLGAAMQTAPTGWAGGALALAAVFAPAFLLIVGALPFWESLRAQPRVRAALMGVNAAVVGLLLAALWNPVITSGIRGVGDGLLAGVALVALMKWKWPPWVVVAGCAGVGWVMGSVAV
ncbi:chromate efflux transporter [Hydrogenophaga aromaticivorans]|uniref:chromate efflux transporter n=1 Tax=Hydrogenophaga aromaticivorans TaxID=2610898 RepID=UPI001B360E54|nr:chromate efflux transporter [Hydrogenophaga aromaticivorans]MBQ0921892.1 chromate efflux transporter [Hydrogenophaga aromaticivorans]